MQPENINSLVLIVIMGLLMGAMAWFHHTESKAYLLALSTDNIAATEAFRTLGIALEKENKRKG